MRVGGWIDYNGEHWRTGDPGALVRLNVVKLSEAEGESLTRMGADRIQRSLGLNRIETLKEKERWDALRAVILTTLFVRLLDFFGSVNHQVGWLSL